MLKLLGVKNTSTQAVLTNGIVNLGAVYRKFCKKVNCIPTFSFNGNSIVLNQKGIYHITTVLVGNATEAGDVSIQLLENGVPTLGAVSTETFTTATTEFRTFTIDYEVLVDDINILGCETSSPKTITFTNTGVGTNLTSVVVNVAKEV